MDKHEICFDASPHCSLVCLGNVNMDKHTKLQCGDASKHISQLQQYKQLCNKTNNIKLVQATILMNQQCGQV